MEATPTRIWLIWALGCTSTFTYLELRGYYGRRNPTLSRELQCWTGYRPRRPWGRVAPLVFAGFGTWLSWHLLALDEEPPAKADRAHHVPGGTA